MYVVYGTEIGSYFRLFGCNFFHSIKEKTLKKAQKELKAIKNNDPATNEYNAAKTTQFWGIEEKRG